MIRTFRPGRALALAGALSVAACADGFLHEPAADGVARVAITALQVADGATSAFDKADRLQVRVTASADGRLLYDGSVPVSADGGPIRASLEVDLVGRPVQALIEVGVRRGADDLFLGEGGLALVPGEESQVSLELRPVVDRLDLPEIPEFTSYGEVLPLAGDVLFATGDVIPGAALEWTSLTPDILEVEAAPGGGYQAVARADGVASLQAAYGTANQAVEAAVYAVVVDAELIPSSGTLRVGESVDFDVLLYDAAENLVPNRTSEWASSDPAVATVDENGVVTAVALGAVDISATHEGVTAMATVAVRDRPSVGAGGTRGVTPNGGTVGGPVNPRGLPTVVYIEWGLDPNLADAIRTPSTTIDGNDPVEVFQTLVNLQPATTYYFRIVAENALGRTESPIYSFTTPGVDTLQAPSGLTAVGTPGGGTRLDWNDNSTGETRFEIERLVGSGPAVIVASVGTDVTTWTDPSPPANTVSYRVRACNADACSAWSNAAPAPPPATNQPAPPAVTTLTPIQPALGEARLLARIDARGAATTVRFDYGTDPALIGAATTSSRLLLPTATHVTVAVPVSGLQPATTYYVRAWGVNSEGRTDGAIVSFTTVDLPAAPSGLAATGDGYGGVRLTWNDNSFDETRFQLERQEVASGQLVGFNAGADAQVYNDTSPPPGDLRYRVRACNAAGCSPFTGWVTYQGVLPPPPAAPSGLSLTWAGAAGLILDWSDNSTNEAGFEIERVVVGPGTAAILPAPAGSVQYTDASPPAGLIEYRVRACNAGGCSAWIGPVGSYWGLAPQVANVAATNVSFDGATLGVDVNPLQAPTTVVFRLATDPAFTSSTVVPTPPLDAGSGATPVSLSLTIGLQEKQQYYLRAEATNLWGTTFSSVVTFTAAPGGQD